MNNLYKTLILFFFILMNLSAHASTLPVALEAKTPQISHQDKPKGKEEKSENTDSPLTVMFRELLGYIYTPAISPAVKTEKMASSGKEIEIPKEEKKLPAH